MPEPIKLTVVPAPTESPAPVLTRIEAPISAPVENLKEPFGIESTAHTEKKFNENVDLTHFLTAKSGAESPKIEAKEKTAEELKVEAAKLPAPVVAAKPVVVATPANPKDVSQAVLPTVAPAKVVAGARDYSEIDEADVPLFKQMGNEFFNKLKPLYVEHKANKQLIAAKDNEIKVLKENPNALPPSYYEHPQGFALSPEFHKAAQTAQLASEIYNHWQEQLINIRMGKDWQDADIDPKSGKLVLSKPITADSKAEIAVNNYLLSAQQQYLKVNGKVEEIQQNFNTRHKADVAVLQDADKTYFTNLQDEKNPLWNTVLEAYKAIPESFKGSPMAMLLAKSIAVNIAAVERIKELSAGQQTVEQLAAAKLADAAKAGPTQQQINNGDVGSIKEGVTMDKFEAAKRGY